MQRQIFIACLPYLAAIALGVVVLRGLVRIAGPRLRLGELRRLPRDEAGGVQSLSFVLTLPLFVMILMFIVQLSQITIARIVVEYSAFAAARAAMVWIPANLGPGYERENQLGTHRTEGGVNAQGYEVYQVPQGTPKFSKIHFAAATACLSISPSRATGAPRKYPPAAIEAISAAYRAMNPASSRNPRIMPRLANKLAYAFANTTVQIEVHHKPSEPQLRQYQIEPNAREFEANEFGWQDQIYVTVVHQFALLPGPGRLLARRAVLPAKASDQREPTDSVAGRIGTQHGTYVYPLTAHVRLSVEGEKPALSFTQTVPLY